MLTRRGLITGAAASLALPARAQLPLTGAGSGVVGGGAYHASAVHFDGTSASLHIASLSSTDNAFSSLVFWIRAAAFTANKIVCVTSPELFFTNYVQIFPSDGSIAYNAASGDGASVLEADSISPVFTPDTWACVIATADTNHPAGQKISKVYIGDTDISCTFLDSNPAFTIGTNGLSFFLGDDGGGNSFAFDMADFRFMPGISLLTAGNIPEATRRLFIDAGGKPVDPAVATAALGTPAVLFSGNATTFGTNQGNGGAFTPTGSLTNASTSPSD